MLVKYPANHILDDITVKLKEKHKLNRHFYPRPCHFCPVRRTASTTCSPKSKTMIYA